MRTADSLWPARTVERPEMEPIARADVAAFRNGGTLLANALIEHSGIRVDAERRRGRGAGVNPSGRYEPVSRHVFDDGWETIEELPPGWTGKSHACWFGASQAADADWLCFIDADVRLDTDALASAVVSSFDRRNLTEDPDADQSLQ